MGHRARIDEPDAIHHVIGRGNCKQAIYFDNLDRRDFLERLGRTTERHRFLCLSYCLMTNHYHLVVETPDGGLSVGIQQLHTGYSRRTNDRHGRCDHLFRQRFGSVRIESESHLMETLRYVVLNPVRAGLCRVPEDWRWSSYRALSGLEFGPQLLAEERLLSLFDADPETARRRYRNFVYEALPAALEVSDTMTGGARARPERVRGGGYDVPSSLMT